MTETQATETTPDQVDPDTIRTGWSISKALDRKIGQLASDLRGEIDEMRDEVAEKSERWQESDKADEVGAWLDQLDELYDQLEAVDPKPS